MATMNSVYSKPNAEVYKTVRDRHSVVLPAAGADGQILATDEMGEPRGPLGVLRPSKPLDVYYDTDKGGYFSIKTGEPALPPSNVEPEFVPYDGHRGSPKPELDGAPEPARTTSKTQRRKARSKPAAPTPTQAPSTSRNVNAGVTVRLHAGGATIPIQYESVVLKEDGEYLVLVSDQDAETPDFGPHTEVGFIKLTLNGRTHTCAAINVDYIVGGKRHQVLMLHSDQED